MAKTKEKEERNTKPVLSVVLPAVLLLLAAVALAISIKVHVDLNNLTERLEKQEYDLDRLQDERREDETLSPSPADEQFLMSDDDVSDYVVEEEEEEEQVPEEQRESDTEEAISKSKKNKKKQQHRHRGGVLCGVGSDCNIPKGAKRLTPLAHVQIIAKDTDDSANIYRLEQEMLEDGMQLESDALVVPVSGYYFVYSQVHLSDPRSSHATLVNSKPMWSGDNDKSSLPTPDYHGGVVRLEANDRLSVGLPDQLSTNDLKNSFLGAFYVGNDKKERNKDGLFFGRLQ